MATAWDYLEQLCRHPHRGTATGMEEAASADLVGWLTGMGYETRVDPFRAPRDTLYLGPSVVMLGFVISAFIGLRWPWAGLLLAILCIAPMVGELLGSNWLDFDRLLPRYPSRNVVAHRGTTGPARHTLVLSAHFDTQRASLLFHPSFVRWLQPYFTLVYILLAVVPVLLALRGAVATWAWTAPALWAAAGLLGINILFLLLCRLTGGYINGANDNGSGTALALALAERLAHDPPGDIELIILMTGAEETGTRGMKHFMRQAKFDPTRTSFINLDNIGGGSLHYLQGEGMIRLQPYGKELLALAERMASEFGGRVRPKRNLLLPTDGYVPALAGYQAISFLAFADDGSLPDYHWYTDTLERVDRELLAFAEAFLAEYVARLTAHRTDSSSLYATNKH